MRIPSFSYSTQSSPFENYSCLRPLSKIHSSIVLGCFTRNFGIGSSSRDRFARTTSCRQSPKNQQSSITLASAATPPISLSGCSTTCSEGSRRKRLWLMCWACFKARSRPPISRVSKIHRSMKACRQRWSLRTLR